MGQFAECWEGLEDPRTGNAKLHDLHELLFIALCTVPCGGQNAVDMVEFAASKGFSTSSRFRRTTSVFMDGFVHANRYPDKD